MNPSTRSRWHISLAGFAVAAALAIGATLAWADTAPATAPAGTAAPASPASHQAAVMEFSKARDLYEKQQYPEAQAENEKALKLEPGLQEALLLKRIIAGKLADGSGAGAGGNTAETQGSTGPQRPHFLTPADIALIKADEWQSKADANVRGTIERKTLETFWNDVMRKQGDAASMSKEAHDAFVAQTNFTNQVREMQRNGDPAFLEKIKFNADPQSIAIFKRTIEPYVLHNCAECHTGDKGGNFRLYKPANGANEQTLYTNFYILSMYANADGKMIDRDQAKTSLLLQYGMIKSKAAKPHPGKVEVKYFTDASDPRFDPMVDWIKGLAFPRPNYGIVYELPGSAPAPSTQPAKPAK